MSKKELIPESKEDSRAQKLLSWYRRHRRDLPWRRTRDPYAIWVSEIMLQQTQVAKVEPYFEAFMARFPTLEALAEAELEKVLATWTGLGYYRRARFLHRAAGELVGAGRSMPCTAADLLELPGIGAYTAAAIASIAYDEIVPVLDGNVERVICRLLALGEDPKKSRTRKRLLSEAETLLDRRAPGESNQALMELGATVCRPQKPRCLVCPLREHCRGRKSPENYPAPKKKRALERVMMHVALVQRDGRRLFFRRPRKAELMAGLWELPTVEKTIEAKLEKRAEKGSGGGQKAPAHVEEELGERYGGSWRLEPAIASVRHGITYRSITAHVHPATVTASGEVASGPEARWIAEEEMGDHAMSSLVAKILGAVEG